MKRTVPFLAALLLPLAAAAQSDERCTLPGELLAEDPSGDAGLQPGIDGLPDGQDDILSFHAAEPGNLPGTLAFTITLRGLATVPPGYRYVVYFNPPGQEAAGYWAAMITDGPAPRFAYGTSSVLPTADAPVPLRVFEEAGTLNAASNFTSEGVITLVVDKSAVGNPTAGNELTGVLTTARRSVPGALMGPGLTVDRAPAGEAFYLLIGNESCGSSKSGVLGAGAFGLPVLLGLLGLAALRRRAH